MKQRWATKCQKCIKRQLLCTARCALRKTKQARGKPLKLLSWQKNVSDKICLNLSKVTAAKFIISNRKTVQWRHGERVWLLAPLMIRLTSQNLSWSCQRSDAQWDQRRYNFFKEIIVPSTGKVVKLETIARSKENFANANFTFKLTPKFSQQWKSGRACHIPLGSRSSLEW